MAVSLVYASRRGPGQEYVKSTLGDIILKLIAYDKSLEVDPLKIYQEMIDNEEVERPAEADKLLLEVTTTFFTLFLRVVCISQIWAIRLIFTSRVAVLDNILVIYI